MLIIKGYSFYMVRTDKKLRYVITNHNAGSVHVGRSSSVVNASVEGSFGFRKIVLKYLKHIHIWQVLSF